MTRIPHTWVFELEEQRSLFRVDGRVTQSDVDTCTACWLPRRDQLCRNDKSELLQVVDRNGMPTGVTAQRWLCHLLGLRHRCVNVLLRWPSQKMGTVLVLQIRSWTKLESPGHVDISVGGHVVGDAEPEATALLEMHEELGITASHLTENGIEWRGAYESPAEAVLSDGFFNCEWRDVYVAELRPECFHDIHFNDSEVVGLYLAPESEAERLLQQETIPFASALRHSLPMCLDGLF